MWMPVVLAALAVSCGCRRIPGNYPDPRRGIHRICARFQGTGYVLTGHTRVPLDRFQQELGNLKGQGFSPYDPGIQRSVARRLKIPTGLLNLEPGREYYRISVRVDPGWRLVLHPGAILLTLKTSAGVRTIRGTDCLLEDSGQESGLASIASTSLEFHHGPNSVSRSWRLLVPSRIKGKILAVEVDPVRIRNERPGLANAALGEAGGM